MSVKSKVASIQRNLSWFFRYPISPSKKLWVLWDYLKLHRQKGITREEYYDFEFEKQSKEFRDSFLGLNEQRHYLDLLNPIKYYSLARNKYLTHKMLENAGVRKATLYCYYQPEGYVYGSDEIASDLANVCRILKAKNVKECVVKATESSHGDNVWVIRDIVYSESDALLTRFDGSRLKLSDILKNDALVFESVIRQTKQFASFNESSVNTVRFMTLLYPDGNAKIIPSWMKFGRRGKCVDNAGSGGNLDASVDVNSGIIKNVVQFGGWRKAHSMENHPDSGTKLNGVKIENWEQIKADVEKFQQAFPWCKAAGWDIAITDEGPVVIEVNDFWDRTGQYFIRRGWRNEVRDCYLAWKKENRDYAMYRQKNELSIKQLIKIESYE